MVKLYFFDKNKTYIFPNGKIGTPDITAKEFPAAAAGLTKFVVTSDEEGITMMGMDMFSNLKSRFAKTIDYTNMTDDQILAEIENTINNPKEGLGFDDHLDPTPEERIAAALEYQNLMAMPDVDSE